MENIVSNYCTQTINEEDPLAQKDQHQYSTSISCDVSVCPPSYPVIKKRKIRKRVFFLHGITVSGERALYCWKFHLT